MLQVLRGPLPNPCLLQGGRSDVLEVDEEEFVPRRGSGSGTAEARVRVRVGAAMERAEQAAASREFRSPPGSAPPRDHVPDPSLQDTEAA